MSRFWIFLLVTAVAVAAVLVLRPARLADKLPQLRKEASTGQITDSRTQAGAVAYPSSAAPREAASVRLFGTILPGRQGDSAFAVMSVDGQPASLFRVGETVAPNTVLVEIDADQVLLDQLGRRIAIYTTTAATDHMQVEDPRNAAAKLARSMPGFISNPRWSHDSADSNAQEPTANAAFKEAIQKSVQKQ